MRQRGGGGERESQTPCAAQYHPVAGNGDDNELSFGRCRRCSPNRSKSWQKIAKLIKKQSVDERANDDSDQADMRTEGVQKRRADGQTGRQADRGQRATTRHEDFAMRIKSVSREQKKRKCKRAKDKREQATGRERERETRG